MNLSEPPPTKRARAATPLDNSADLVEPVEPTTMVKKPVGEPGRPGTGGFNIELSLKWHPTAFNKLKVNANSLAFF